MRGAPAGTPLSLALLASWGPALRPRAALPISRSPAASGMSATISPARRLASSQRQRASVCCPGRPGHRSSTGASLIICHKRCFYRTGVDGLSNQSRGRIRDGVERTDPVVTHVQREANQAVRPALRFACQLDELAAPQVSERSLKLYVFHRVLATTAEVRARSRRGHVIQAELERSDVVCPSPGSAQIERTRSSGLGAGNAEQGNDEHP